MAMNEYTTPTRSSLDTPLQVGVVHAYRVDRGWDGGWRRDLGVGLSSEEAGLSRGRKVEEEKMPVKNKWARNTHSKYTRRLPAFGGGARARFRVLTLIFGSFLGRAYCMLWEWTFQLTRCEDALQKKRWHPSTPVVDGSHRFFLKIP